MKVNDQNAASSAAADLGRTQDIQKSDRSGVSRSGSQDSSGDRVEFSSALGRLSQTLSTESAQRSSRVQQVAAAYQNGTYRADPTAISKAMVGDAIASGAF